MVRFKMQPREILFIEDMRNQSVLLPPMYLQGTEIGKVFVLGSLFSSEFACKSTEIDGSTTGNENALWGRRRYYVVLVVYVDVVIVIVVFPGSLGRVYRGC
jgi:hypothetical protein